MSQVSTHNTAKMLLGLAIVGILIFGAVALLNMPDRRTPGERIGDAIDAMSDGAKDAGRELQPRTPAEKLEDAVKDTGEELKRH